MKRKDLKFILNKEKHKFSNKPFEDLMNINSPELYEINFEKNHCQIEVQLIEKEENYLNISMAIDDKSLLCSIFPVTLNFIVKK